MSDDILTFCFIGVLAEFAVLMFILFRRVRGSCLAQAVFGFFGFFSTLMVVLAVVGTIERPLAFTDGAYSALPAAFVVLALVIVRALFGGPWAYANTPAGDRARVRDRIKPPRKRPLIVDVLGCAVVGALSLVLLGVGIVIAIGLAR